MIRVRTTLLPTSDPKALDNAEAYTSEVQVAGSAVVSMQDGKRRILVSMDQGEEFAINVQVGDTEIIRIEVPRMTT